MARLTLLRPEDPPGAFPDPGRALTNPDGLLAVGGDLSPGRLIAAYRLGIFPWFEAGQPILWWSPDPRAILRPEAVHVSRRLARTLRTNRFSVSADLAFGEVIRQCASTRARTGTWITADMIEAYVRLHQLGHAHSVETWCGDELVGGIYGVVLGGVFFGESMFSRRPDASKVALVRLAELLCRHGVELLDCQVASAHLGRMGAQLVPRAWFLRRLRSLVDRPVAADWREPRQETAGMAAAGLRVQG